MLSPIIATLPPPLCKSFVCHTPELPELLPDKSFERNLVTVI
jgi:hypothetical protein